MESSKPKKSYLTTTRRVFTNSLMGGIIGGIIGWFLYPIFRFLIPPKNINQDSNIVKLNTTEIPVGKSKVIRCFNHRLLEIRAQHTPGKRQNGQRND